MPQFLLGSIIARTGSGSGQESCSTPQFLWGQGGLGQAAAPTGMHESQGRLWDVPGWAMLQHPPARAETVGRSCQARSKHSLASASSKAENGLGRLTLGMPCQATAITGECKSQS